MGFFKVTIGVSWIANVGLLVLEKQQRVLT